MYLDWSFAWLILPLAVIGVGGLAFGSWLKEKSRSETRRSWRYPAMVVLVLSLFILGIVALAIMANLFGPIALITYCTFATCG